MIQIAGEGIVINTFERFIYMGHLQHFSIARAWNFKEIRKQVWAATKMREKLMKRIGGELADERNRGDLR
jgi:hypothetical protein